MKRISLAALLLLAITHTLAAPQEDTIPLPPWAGVWEGTVGPAPVRVCLQPFYDDSPSGSYYYKRHLRLIRLNAPRDAKGKAQTPPAGQPLLLTETLPTPAPTPYPPATPPHEHTAVWSLSLSADGQALEGQWRSPSKQWPLRLARLASTDEPNAPCASDTFNTPRETPARVVTSPAKAKAGGTAYRALALDFGNRFDSNIESFELLRGDEGTRRFNEAQRKALLAEQAEVFSCTRNVLSRYASPGDYHREIKPVHIGRQWMVTTELGSDECGGAHPNAYMRYRLWHLAAEGVRQVDPWLWFHPKGASVEVHGQGESRYTSVQMGDTLKATLMKVWPRSADDECRTVIDESNTSWDLYPTPQGMVFMPVLPHVVYACTDEVTLPWPRVRPLLNAEGRKAVDAIQADFRHPPPR